MRDITDLDPMRFGCCSNAYSIRTRFDAGLRTSTSARTRPARFFFFCVIDYVQKRYGRDSGQIITSVRCRRAGVLRDVAAGCRGPTGKRLNDKAGAAEYRSPVKWRRDASEPKLQASRTEDAVVARAFDLAQRLEGLPRNASTHAAACDRRPPASEQQWCALPRAQIRHAGAPVKMKWVERRASSNSTFSV